MTHITSIAYIRWFVEQRTHFPDVINTRVIVVAAYRAIVVTAMAVRTTVTVMKTAFTMDIIIEGFAKAGSVREEFDSGQEVKKLLLDV